MNEKKYYFILCTSKGSIGIPYEPKPRSFNDFQWGQPLKKCENLEYELKDGGYVPLMESFCRGKLVTEEVKTLFESYLEPNAPVSFYPATIKSGKYGDKKYYLMHFSSDYDVVDLEGSITINGNMIRPCLDIDKVGDKKIFHTRYKHLIIESEEVKKALKANKLDKGVEYYPFLTNK